LKHDAESNRSFDATAATLADAALVSNEGEFDPLEITVETEVSVVWTLAAQSLGAPGG
jgi:hypothetical protein